MISLGITGINGLIGWHLNVFFKDIADVKVVGADRSTFASEDLLDEFVSQVDVIIHLAGLNRGDDREIESTNILLVQNLLESTERTQCFPNMLFASSTHIDGESAYGRSKRKCAELFRDWSKEHNVGFANLILPHVFGEGGKPFYNSVVSTFCYQLAHDETPQIIVDGQLELLHAQKFAYHVNMLIRQPISGDQRIYGLSIKVSELLTILNQMWLEYREQLIPDLSSELHLALFNSFRSYLFPAYYPVALKLFQDQRGALFEAVRSENGGQCFMSTTRPGITRGNHYHHHKVERFLVVSGEAVIRARRIFSDEVVEFSVAGNNPEYIDIPTFHAHNITNVGDKDLITLFWSHEIFDPNDPDTIAETV